MDWRINAAGQWVKRSEHASLNELSESMTQHELEALRLRRQSAAVRTGAAGATTATSVEESDGT